MEAQMNRIILLVLSALVDADGTAHDDHCLLQKAATMSKASKEPGVDLDSLDLDMARLSGAAYVDFSNETIPASDGGEWKRLGRRCVTSYGDTDCLAGYAKDDVAVLVFKGTDMTSISDWMQDLNVGTTDFCGLKNSDDALTRMHKGFVHHLLTLIIDPITGSPQNPRKGWKTTAGWESLKSVLRQYKKLYVTGHSLGGALATLFAACANRPGESSGEKEWHAGHHLLQRALQHFKGSSGDDHKPIVYDSKKAVGDLKVSGLYTFAAPAVSKEALNDNGHDFQGRRVYVDDLILSDPVPWLYETVGFKHPLVQQVRLTRKCNTCGVHADGSKSIAELAENLKTKLKTAAVHLHYALEYVKRITSVVNHEIQGKIGGSLPDAEADNGQDEDDASDSVTAKGGDGGEGMRVPATLPASVAKALSLSLVTS